MSAPAPELVPEVPAAETPPVEPRRRLLRTLIVVGLSLLMIIGLVVTAGYVIISRFDHAVTRATLLEPDSRVVPPPTQHGAVVGPLNFLLLGSDYRVEDPSMGQRSDTIIVAHVTQALDRVYLVSIPRDLKVHIPAFPEFDFPGDDTKINAAFQFGRGGFGGARLVSATLTNLLGIQFNGAAAIDFAGLMRVVDLLDGVTMCVDTPVTSLHTGRVFTVGCELMTSDVALDYLRQRDFPDGDFTRQRHQQQFLNAIFDQVLAANTLTNPVRLDTLLQAMAGAMTVDLGSTNLTDLLFALRGLRPGGLIGLKVPFSLAMIGDVSYVLAGDDAPGLYQALSADTLDDWTAVHAQWVNQI